MEDSFVAKVRKQSEARWLIARLSDMLEIAKWEFDEDEERVKELLVEADDYLRSPIR